MNALYYSPSINRFKDRRGEIVHDVYPLFDTWQLDHWKKRGGYSDYIIAKDGNIWELLYLTDKDTLDLDKLDMDKFGELKLDRILY